MSSSHREAIAKPSCTIRNNIVCKTTSSFIFVSASGILVSYSCVHRVTIGRLRVCVGSILDFHQIRDENRAKFKLSYSCGHRVSKSARYDATLTVSFSQTSILTCISILMYYVCVEGCDIHRHKTFCGMEFTNCILLSQKHVVNNTIAKMNSL